MRFLHWLYPGLQVKRWVALTVTGLLLFILGFLLFLPAWAYHNINVLISTFFLKVMGSYNKSALALLFMAAGGSAAYFGLKKAGQSLLEAVFPEDKQNQVMSAYYKQTLRRGPKIVVIGGGTGLSVLLRGLKEITSNITAVVAVTDDGGSSGILRGQFGILPPGDLRNCLVALADTEPAMESLFNYRFSRGQELAGHSMGNLLITAIAEMTGSFEKAIEEAAKVLAIRGRVLPCTLDNLVLAAEMKDGSVVVGESNIGKANKEIKRVYTIPGDCKPSSEAMKAILEADLIIMGPGSLYTSIIPNLLVPGMADVMQKACGFKVYVCNIMTQPGETIGYSASDHLKAIYQHAAIGAVDCIIVNSEKIPPAIKERYATEGAAEVLLDKENLSHMKVEIITAPLLDGSGLVRHHPHKLAHTVLNQFLSKRGPASFSGIVDYYLLKRRIKRVEGWTVREGCHDLFDTNKGRTSPDISG